MLDLEKLLTLDSKDSITQTRINFLLDKNLENIVFGFLTHYGASAEYRIKKEPIDSQFTIEFADDISQYLDLRKKMIKSVNRYSPYLSFKDDKNMVMFNLFNITHVSAIEYLSFSFTLSITAEMKLKTKLDKNLKAKSNSQKIVKI